MDDDHFFEAYNRLNSKQKEAVDTIEGPVMVVAGPGTGKTQILTLRIANILKKTQTSPENILALTFTESGAHAMRSRLSEYMGALAYRVSIFTFHEFSGRCIRTYTDSYERGVGGRPINDLEKFSLVASILETPSLKLLRPRGNTTFYVTPIIGILSYMKREYITPEKFAYIIEKQENIFAKIPTHHEKGVHAGKIRNEYIQREKAIHKNRELLFVYKAYEAALHERNNYDYDDMIFETVNALTSDESMLRSLQEEYQYILADEHQDVNGSQNKILELLASFHERPNLFVVGDEKQSIYRFQGASLENFLYFEEKFPYTKTIGLTENYRSVQSILDLSHELITMESGAASDLRIPLHANHTGDGSGIIDECLFSHEAVEHEYVANSIKSLLAQDVPMDEIAIIVRTNREVEELSLCLRKQGIRTESSSDNDILLHPITLGVRSLIQAVADPSNEQALFTILHGGYFDISPGDLVHIMSSRSYLCPLAYMVTNKDVLITIGVTEPEKVLRLAHILTEARSRTSVEAPYRVLEYVLTESGFLDHILAIDPLESGRVIRRLYDEVQEMVHHERMASFAAIEESLNARIVHGLPLSAPYIKNDTYSVQVMTVHKAKGLEFSHVFIPHVTDTRWGGNRHIEYFDVPKTEHVQPETISALDDERKLLYVAFTRAKTALHLSSSHMNSEGRTQLRTRLLEGVGKTYIENIDVSDFEKAFDPSVALRPVIGRRSIDVSFLKHNLTKRGLSVTALNNYLHDPWTYFYRNVIHIPEIQSESARFGTVLHDTLRDVMSHRRERGKLPNSTIVVDYLKKNLGKLPITIHEFTRYHEQGIRILSTYLAYLKDVLPHSTKEEIKIQATYKTEHPEAPEILLTGLIDRLDVDVSGKIIRIVDYKSGKPRTRGYIEGKTKNSLGDYKRQLTFYALLLKLQGNPQYQCREGVLSFVEPDDKGKIHEETYIISEQEIYDLQQEITRVALEIVQGTFLHTQCDPKKSSYCHLAGEFQNKL